MPETFKNLSIWNKWGLYGSIASIVALPLAIYFYYASPSASPHIVAPGNRGAVVDTLHGNLIINPTPPPRKIDWQLIAQSSRTVADANRNLAESHLPRLLPSKWLEAEKLYQQGTEQYERSEYQQADQSFDAAGRIYQDLWSKYKDAPY